MLIPFVPLTWCMVQVSLLACIALLIAYSLRGRYPQMVSAVIAGSCIAASLLFAQVWIPTTQWSVTSMGWMESSNLVASSNALSFAKADQPTETQGDKSTSSGLLNNKTVSAKSDSVDSHSTNSPVLRMWINRAMGWALAQVQSLDQEVRGYETAENVSRDMMVRCQWIMGVLFLILGTLWGYSWIWTRCLVRRSRLIHDARLLDRVSDHSKRMRLPNVPEVRVSSTVAIGATVGCFRKIMILNPDWETWSDAELDAVLLHEMAHMVRNDFTWVVFGSWIRVLFFFHPLMHLLVRRWRLEQELAADQLAAGAMKNANVYGRALASLALRSQYGARISNTVLTANQVCIVRRITMLKQGSLKPMNLRQRWAPLWTSLAVVALMSLSGLRGAPPDVTVEKAVEKDKIVADRNGGDGEVEKHAVAPPPPLTPEQRKKKSEEFQRTQEAYPPVEITGRLKWNPGKLLTQDVSPAIRYLQDLAAFALFEQFPADAEIHCPANMNIKWESMAREHGNFSFGLVCNESHGIAPALMARIMSNTQLGNLKPSTHTKSIGGRTATGLVAQKWDANYEARVDESEPSKWIIQDGEHFYFGSETEIEAQLQGTDTSENSPSLISIPSIFGEEYKNAALALVFSDCDQLCEKLRKFQEGCPKEAEFEVAVPYLTGLQQVGLFVTSEDGVTIKTKLEYDSVAAAKRVTKVISGLILMAIATSDDPMQSMLLKSLNVENVDQSICITMRDNGFAKLACNEVLPEKMPGWTDILTLVTPSDVPGTVKFVSEHPFATAGFLSQSLRAKQYQGKRIRVSAELGCTDSVHERTGVIVWGSDSQNDSVGNAVSGDSIGKPVDPNALDKKILTVLDNALGGGGKNVKPEYSANELHWQTKTVEWNVPVNANALSFGLYTAAGEVLVRNVQFEVVGNASSEASTFGLISLPRNLMRVPGRPLLDEPTNLDFSSTKMNTPSDAPHVHSADASNTAPNPPKTVR